MEKAKKHRNPYKNRANHKRGQNIRITTWER